MELLTTSPLWAAVLPVVALTLAAMCAPILIMLNAKEGEATVPGGVTPLEFTEPLFDALDAEIRSVFGDDRLITPDEVQGKAKTLREAVLAGGWPKIGQARGKVFFALDEGPKKIAIYRGKRASLLKLVVSPAWRFWRGYLLRGGFLDGWHGLVYAYVRANYVRQKTVMLWLLQNGQAVADPPATPSSADKA